jgi:ribosomal protein S18 acetylase RimI-like enzyme
MGEGDRLLGMTGRFNTRPTLFSEAAHGDEAVLTPIVQRTIATCFHPFLGVDKTIAVLDYDSVSGYIVENLGQNYCPILLLDGEPVGFAVCKDVTIDLIIIDYQYHRLGLGTKLLAHCESEMFQAYPAISLQCFEPNEQANRFFQKHGWTETLTYNDKQTGARTIVYQKLWNDGKKK